MSAKPIESLSVFFMMIKGYNPSHNLVHFPKNNRCIVDIIHPVLSNVSITFTENHIML